MTQLAVAALSREEARSLTDEVKHDAERLWRKLVELYDGGAHLALGYSSWKAYFEAEFGQSGKRGEQLLQAGRVLGVIQGTNGSLNPTNERQARALVPLLSEPEKLRDAWHEASSDGAPTALKVRFAHRRQDGYHEQLSGSVGRLLRVGRIHRRPPPEAAGGRWEPGSG